MTPRDPDMEVARTDDVPTRYEVRNVERYGGGLACFTTFETEAEAEAWIDGYEQGARENM